jgi:hypothetical protein
MCFLSQKYPHAKYGGEHTFMEAICHAEKPMQNPIKNLDFRPLCSTSYSETLLSNIFHIIPAL